MGGGDCDDGDATVHPDADEVPDDGIDQDCDRRDLVDADGDGAQAAEIGGPDCDDADDAIGPHAEAIPYDGVDQDCADGDLVDVDGDGFVATEVGGDDCYDGNPDAFPGALDRVGDRWDLDCDGTDGVDLDGDRSPGRDSGGRDCDDTDPSVFPGAPDAWYDGADTDCARNCDWDADRDEVVAPGAVVVDGDACDLADGPGDADCDDTDPRVGDATPRTFDPQDGALAVSRRVVVAVDLRGDDPGAAIALRDPDGAAVVGASALDGRTVSFAPAAPLPGDATYEATLTTACGVTVWSFTTAPDPTPVADPTVLVGLVYAFDLSDAVWTLPDPSIAAIVAGLLPRDAFRLGVVAADADRVDLRLASGEGGQDECAVTGELSAPFANPGFATDPELVALRPYEGEDPWLVEDAALSGFLGETALTDGQLVGRLDTRGLVEVIAPGGADDAVCNLLVTFGVVCGPCAAGGDFCVPIAAEQVDGAVLVEDPPIEITQADVDANCP